ncbi:MAG TPA: DinB family protein [Candidatus Acidoferrales bacterium]|nr:DinB family protein [Candidatus Acidoferrales bacterium]
MKAERKLEEGHVAIGRPNSDEAAPYYFTYINQVVDEDVVSLLEKQCEEAPAFFGKISAEKSLYRYAPDKWSIREVVGHLCDAERVFAHRALWFARGHEEPLPSFEQNIAVANAKSDQIEWAEHIEEFRRVHLSSVALFRNMPADAWMRRGSASGNSFTVRALAFVIAGHLTHHVRILRERYL